MVVPQKRTRFVSLSLLMFFNLFQNLILTTYPHNAHTNVYLWLTNAYQYQRNISSRLFSNSEASASRLLRNLKEIFLSTTYIMMSLVCWNLNYDTLTVTKRLILIVIIQLFWYFYLLFRSDERFFTINLKFAFT